MYDVQNENRGNNTITVDMDYCNGCEECLYVCPTDAISMSEVKAKNRSLAKAVIKLERCNLCGACVFECPVRAIKIK